MTDGIRSTYLDMLRMADHIHVENPSFVKTLDDMLWWNTDCAYKQLRSGLNEDINQPIKSSFGIIITCIQYDISFSANLQETLDPTSIDSLTLFSVHFLQSAAARDQRQMVHFGLPNVS